MINAPQNAMNESIEINLSSFSMASCCRNVRSGYQQNAAWFLMKIVEYSNKLIIFTDLHYV